MSFSKTIFFVLMSISCWALTEEEAVRQTLDRNTSIRILSLKRGADSLNLLDAQAAYLPALTASAGLLVAPLDNAFLDGSAGLKASQLVPGGGKFEAVTEPSFTRALSSDSASSGTSVAVSFTQPLLRDAWGNAAAAYVMRIERLDHERFTHEQRKALAASLSGTRALFWTCYEKQRLLAISTDALNNAERLLAKARALFSVGSAAAIDTMSAMLELLKAREAQLNDRVEFEIARDNLAEALAIEPASVVLPESIAVAIIDLPEADLFLQTVRRYDPQLHIFDIVRRMLGEQLDNERNDLLPAVDLSAAYLYDDRVSENAAILDNSVVSLIVSYSLPTRKRRIQRARTQLSRQENELKNDDYERRLHNSIGKLARNWELEKRRLDIAGASCAMAQAYFDAASKGYDLGSVDQLTYLKAQEDLVALSVRFLQRQITLKRLEIVFDELSGNVFSRFGVEVQ